MSIFDIFRTMQRRQKTTSASVARERLQIVVSHRTAQQDPDFIKKLHGELIEVISKYVKIDPEQIKVNLGQTGNCSTLELNVTLPKDGDTPMANPIEAVAAETETETVTETKEEAITATETEKETEAAEV